MKQYQRIYMTHSKLRDVTDDFRLKGFYMIMGANSISIPELKEKYIAIEGCRNWIDIEGQEYLMSPGEAALTELKKLYPEYKAPYHPSYKKLSGKRVPIFYSGPYEGQGGYIDLRGAYYQIGRNMCLNDMYPRGIGTMRLRPALDKLADWKAARNAVFGLMRKSTLRMVKDGKEWTQPTNSKYNNISVWANLMDFLNYLGAIAIYEHKAIYVNTDGYIFQSNHNAISFSNFLNWLGMDYHYIQGDVYVRGWGAYSIQGENDYKETQTYKNFQERITNNVKTTGFNTIQKYFQGSGDYRTSSKRIVQWWRQSQLYCDGLT